MVQVRRSTFLMGFIIALLTALIVWYYQKSTSAETDALELLDRYAGARARIDEMERQTVAPPMG